MTNILIISDQRYYRTLVTQVLVQEGYFVDSVDDAEVVLDYIRSSRPDIVLLDINSNEFDSWEVHRKINTEDENLLVLIYTSNNIDTLEFLKQTLRSTFKENPYRARLN